MHLDNENKVLFRQIAPFSTFSYINYWKNTENQKVNKGKSRIYLHQFCLNASSYAKSILARETKKL